MRIRWTPLLRLYPSYYIALIFSRSGSNFSSIVRNPKRRKCLYSTCTNNLERFSIFSCAAMITNLLIITSLVHFVLYVFTSSNRDKPVNTMSGLEQLEFDSRQIQRSVSSPHLPNGFCDPPYLIFSGYWRSKVTAEVNLVLNLRMHEDTAHHYHHASLFIATNRKICSCVLIFWGVKPCPFDYSELPTFGVSLLPPSSRWSKETNYFYPYFSTAVKPEVEIAFETSVTTSLRHLRKV